MIKQFPVDIYAAKEYGIEKWQREFYWPVPDRDFVKLYIKLESLLRKYIENEKSEASDLLLLQADLRFEYLSFCHAVKVLEEIKKAGMDPIYSSRSVWYQDIMTKNLHTASLTESKQKARFSTVAKSEMAKAARSLIYNVSPYKLMAAGRGDIAYVYNSATPVMDKYMRDANNFFSFTSNADWFSGIYDTEISGGLRDDIEYAHKAIAGEAAEIASGEGIHFSDYEASYLIELTMQALTDAARLIQSASEEISAKDNKKLLVSSFGNSFLRAAAIAMRRAGGRVMSFSHGGSIGLYNLPTLAFSEFALSDEFFTYTKGSIGNFEENKKFFPPLRNNNVAIRSCDSGEFVKLRQVHGRSGLPKNVKKVMIVGYPHNPWRKPHAAAGFSLMQLDFELRLANILKEAGYEIIYKVHPDKKAEAAGIFDNNIKLSSGYFEDCMDEADAYVFGSIRTTAFSIALCTNKPIIGFIMEDEYYRPVTRAMELLKKRCDFVYTHFDERNRIIFEKDAVLSALSKPVKSPDNEFMETYYFPKPWSAQ